MGGAERDVFISYGHADADWVRTLAGNLYQSGLELFFDEWDIAPGDVLVHRIDAGILASRSGILVVSPTALTRPYVQTEYAALMGRAIERGQRLIPVLLKNAEMPPLLASRSGSISATSTAPTTWRASASWSARLRASVPAHLSALTNSACRPAAASRPRAPGPCG